MKKKDDKDPVKVADVLNVGRHRAIQANVLMERLELKSRRDLYNMIQKERLDGEIILADYRYGGYYLPDVTDPEDIREIEHFVYHAEKQAKSNTQAAESAREFLRALTA